MIPVYFDIIVSPKRPLQSLPDDKITNISIIIIISLWIFGVIQNFGITDIYKFDLTLSTQLLLAAFATPIITSLILWGVSNLFRNKITLFKTFNIVCFSLIPYLYFITIITLIYLIFPETKEFKGFNKFVNLIMLLINLYFIILAIYGVAINNKTKNQSNKTLQLTAKGGGN